VLRTFEDVNVQTEGRTLTVRSLFNFFLTSYEPHANVIIDMSYYKIYIINLFLLTAVDN